ncbi:hypothetical protein HOK51_04770 [Candidatus Woesearchaeota archaeon]|jgi:hypothetical protein|nr:hypothetical protein [Candidatus Woesearchaeota archaeon]MBT6519138.1 hypothetical protein [Candidatus Woesearchaeota archaeon]MBT7367771.1 hypothetical protein [Candidatus Woesearchaeota archaeon]
MKPSKLSKNWTPDLEKLDDLVEPLTQVINDMWELMKNEPDCSIDLSDYCSRVGIGHPAKYFKIGNEVSFGQFRTHSNREIKAFIKIKNRLFFRPNKIKSGISVSNFRGLSGTYVFNNVDEFIQGVKHELKFGGKSTRIAQIKTLLKFPKLVESRRKIVNNSIDAKLIPFFSKLNGDFVQKFKPVEVNSQLVAGHECGWTKTLDRLDKLVEPIEQAIAEMYAMLKDEPECIVYLGDKFKRKLEFNDDLFYKDKLLYARRQNGIRFGMGIDSNTWSNNSRDHTNVKYRGIMVLKEKQKTKNPLNHNKYQTIIRIPLGQVVRSSDRYGQRANMDLIDKNPRYNHSFSSAKEFIEHVKYELKYELETAGIDYLKVLVNFTQLVAEDIKLRNGSLQQGLDSLFNDVGSVVK